MFICTPVPGGQVQLDLGGRVRSDIYPRQKQRYIFGPACQKTNFNTNTFRLHNSGCPDASPSSLFKSNDMNDEFLGTNHFFVPDGSNRQIHQIDNKVFHAGYLENGNNAYLLELPALENMLNTRKFLMDEMSGQFYAVYGNSYQRMSTKPML